MARPRFLLLPSQVRFQLYVGLTCAPRQAFNPVMSRATAEIMRSQFVQLNDKEGAAGLEYVQLNCDDSIVRLLTITRGSCLVEWPSAKREWYERRHLRLPAGQGAAELTFDVARLVGWF